MSQICGT